MTNSENPGLTAREAAEAYCLRWTWAGYHGAWRNDSASDIEREEARKTVSDELKEMLCLAFEPEEETASKDVPQVETRKNRILHSGNLPTQREKACETPIIAGLLNGYNDGLPNDICYLRVNAQGAWTLEEFEGAFLGKILGEDLKIVELQFIITRGDIPTLENFATCELTVTIEVSEAQEDNGDGKRMVKHAAWVDSKTGPWISNVNDTQKARKDDWGRKRDGGEVFDGPAPRSLWVKGQPGVNKPLFKLARDDVRDIEIDIEDNSISGDGRKYVGLRFWPSNVAAQQEAEAVFMAHEDTPPGRKSGGETRQRKILNAFDKIKCSGSITGDIGELSALADTLAKQHGYSPRRVRGIIGPAYWDHPATQKNPRNPNRP